MSLCEHGYTANWDCPICPCACGSGAPAGGCTCIMAEAPTLHDNGTVTLSSEKRPRLTLLDPATAWPFPKGPRP